MDIGEDVKRIFTHYFKTLARYAGMNWDIDNDAEIEAAIDQLIKEIKQEIREG